MKTQPAVCATVDVEDFAEGMGVLGHEVARSDGSAEAGLADLLERLGSMKTGPKVTLFVVGGRAASLRQVLQSFADAGHEIASHGPDHGRLPADDVVGWLRRGRDMLEQLLQLPVRGFRSPRFEVPGGELAQYRDALAKAGYSYVSDVSRLGRQSAVRELPVLRWHGVSVGGGSYQRFLPAAVVEAAVRHSHGPAVLYYHSYDFDGTLPRLASARSLSVLKQLVARPRITTRFLQLVTEFGSETCIDVAR
ncbi:MAG TPA: DUF3473 domain-containing protein [Acidimicrobiales bacterium]|nr:DUF3473 domain-containing protein [Acidimicrobiales bacterium]